MEKYTIGDVQFIWDNSNWSLYQDEFIKQFVAESEECDVLQDKIIYKAYTDNLKKYSEGILLQKNGLYELYQMPEGKFIVYHWATCRFAFGFWLEDLEKENIVSCYFDPDMESQKPLDAVRFFSCAGMHSKLLQKGALIFHSSYINWNGKGILFAGRSGTGKSTQADLWKNYADADIINGDRVLLRKREGRWYSYGYPCCGSSKICINRTLPLSLIVILEQGSENKIVPLTIGQKVRALVSGTELFPWNESEINRAFHLAQGLVQDINIVKLVCRPDADAVTTLKKYWEDNEYGKSV